MFIRHINPHHSYQFGNESVKTIGKVGVTPFVPPKQGQVFKIGMPNPNALKSSIQRAK